MTITKKIEGLGAGGMTQRAECLPSKHKALTRNPQYCKKKAFKTFQAITPYQKVDYQSTNTGPCTCEQISRFISKNYILFW
jgi:hypothetical protein